MPTHLAHEIEQQSNRQQFLELIAENNTIYQKGIATAEKVRDKFAKKGKLMPQERLSALLDSQSDFLELSPFAGYDMHDDKAGSSAGGGNIIGIGQVQNRHCMIICNNAAIKGGAVSPMGLKKVLRAQEIALENKLPVIYLIESAGANLLYQSEVFIEGAKVFANQAKLSAAGVVQIACVHGPSTAGGAYMPGLSDYVVVVKNQAKIYLAGPPLLKAATGEIATEENLGGAALHAELVGTAEYLAENDQQGIYQIREICRHLGWKDFQTTNKKQIKKPQDEIDDLLDIVPVDHRYPYDVIEVINRIVDNSDFLPFKAEFDKQTICGHAQIHGTHCGILGNNGPITHQGAVKAAQFIQLCCQSNLPIIYLQNTTGFMVGTTAEQNGIVKHGSKLIQAVTNATVPQITLMIGGSFGAGNYAMCGKGFSPRFIFSWPNCKVGVMGAAQAAGVMSTIALQKCDPNNKEALAQIKKQSQMIEAKMQTETTVRYASARLWDDGIIDPRDSRKILGLTLEICKQNDTVFPNSFGVARF